MSWHHHSRYFECYLLFYLLNVTKIIHHLTSSSDFSLTREMCDKRRTIVISPSKPKLIQNVFFFFFSLSLYLLLHTGPKEVIYCWIHIWCANNRVVYVVNCVTFVAMIHHWWKRSCVASIWAFANVNFNLKIVDGIAHSSNRIWRKFWVEVKWKKWSEHNNSINKHEKKCAIGYLIIFIRLTHST